MNFGSYNQENIAILEYCRAAKSDIGLFRI